jgi:LAS superfamily LD-carboxypeptidase LdcB
MVASALALLLVFASLIPVEPPGPLADTPGYRPLSSLALRLETEPAAVTHDEYGHATAIFGLPASEARMVLLPVDRQRALPDGYVPPDLTWSGGRLVRAIAKPDLTAMIEAASRDKVELVPMSIYRAADEQEPAFEAAVYQAMARSGGTLTREQAESDQARFVAPSGHSQHQLGTAVDFSTGDVNYALQPSFADTDAGHWLEQNAWQYGFVLSYTRNGEARSGYAYEPWHYRWIGRDLAAALQHDNYLNHPTLIADDYLWATEEILAYENVP